MPALPNLNFLTLPADSKAGAVSLDAQSGDPKAFQGMLAEQLAPVHDDNGALPRREAPAALDVSTDSLLDSLVAVDQAAPSTADSLVLRDATAGLAIDLPLAWDTALPGGTSIAAAGPVMDGQRELALVINDNDPVLLVSPDADSGLEQLVSGPLTSSAHAIVAQPLTQSGRQGSAPAMLAGHAAALSTTSGQLRSLAAPGADRRVQTTPPAVIAPGVSPVQADAETPLTPFPAMLGKRVQLSPAPGQPVATVAKQAVVNLPNLTAQSVMQAALPAQNAMAHLAASSEGLAAIAAADVPASDLTAAMSYAPAGAQPRDLASGAPMQLSLNRPLASPEWNQQLGERIQWLADNNQQSAELQLNPRELGPVAIRISVADDVARIAFTAQHPVTREALEAALPHLRDMLQSQGLSLGEANVSADNAARQQGGDGEADRETQAAGTQGEDVDQTLPAAAKQVHDGLFDGYA